MQDSDENKLAYVAIGDAVLNHISHHADISRESLLRTLNNQAIEATNDEKRAHLFLGCSLLSDINIPSDESIAHR